MHSPRLSFPARRGNLAAVTDEIDEDGSHGSLATQISGILRPDLKPGDRLLVQHRGIEHRDVATRAGLMRRHAVSPGAPATR